MPKLVIHQDKVTPEGAAQLQALCPFGAFSWENGALSINAACKMCRVCVKNGPAGVVEYVEEEKAPAVDKAAYSGVAVFAEQHGGTLAPVALELLGKAKELAAVTAQPVMALLVGSGMADAANTLLCHGADAVYLYDEAPLAQFCVEPYAACFEDFINKVKPGSILVGATNLGRSLAPRVAARFGTGLTADCTRLEMKPNTDLVQIRPAFGGNIMAQIVTPRHRPQFCTVRYKVFSAPCKGRPTGKVVPMAIAPAKLATTTRVLQVEPKPRQMDISEAEAIVAVGRGVKGEKDLELARSLAQALNAQLACTRPLIENGWFDAKKQIGLSGRTVKPKIIVTLGVSGSVQFAAGMQNADCIIAVNSDENANIFNIAHHGLVGDLSAVVPLLLQRIGAAQGEVC